MPIGVLSSYIRDVILIVVLIIRYVSFRKHIIGQGFQLSERHVLHGVLYLANQLVSLEIIVIAQARCKSIAHFFTFELYYFECCYFEY